MGRAEAGAKTRSGREPGLEEAGHGAQDVVCERRSHTSPLLEAPLPPPPGNRVQGISGLVVGGGVQGW